MTEEPNTIPISTNKIAHKYGYFTNEQLNLYKTFLHKKLFWLLLYEDPKTKDKFQIDINSYFYNLMKKINGLNRLLFYPVEIVEIMSDLEAALAECDKKDFNYREYRKLILDAHSLVDRIGETND